MAGISIHFESFQPKSIILSVPRRSSLELTLFLLVTIYVCLLYVAASNAGLWRQLGCFQHRWSHEFLKVHVQGKSGMSGLVVEVQDRVMQMERKMHTQNLQSDVVTAEWAV